ncbi:MAG: TRAP transporter substrate-binding protein DctP [Deltaproteobacteria bacterium]
MKCLAQTLFAAAALAAAPAQATILVKLGTVAPQGSPYDKVLQDMARQWAQASGGQVKLRIYPGGVAGNEGDMVRKIGVGQLQAASLTTVGMHDITPEPQALDVPMLVETPEELDYVLAHIQARLEKSLEAKGFVALNWADVGVVRLFSTFPIRSPQDAAKAKVWSWQGDPAAADGWSKAGFQPVVLSSTDIIPSLQTGMINTAAMPALYAFASRTFDKANNMLDLGWGVLTGATLIKKETWDKISPDLQQKLLAISKESGKTLSREVLAMNADAMTQMKAQGLVVNEPVDLAGWTAAAKRSWSVVRGHIVPQDLFDEVKRLVAEYRSTHGK